ncbi:reverse transcriptase domain-containing protein [Tanacetum coccineum]
MPNNVKTYDGTGDLEDHVKNFQAAAQVERWAIPTWGHMFNSTLIGAARVWFDELPSESIDGYKDLKAAFLAYFMQQKKYVKDPVEIHNIKKRDGETIKEFMERFKVETERMKGALECMRISGFMHRVNNPELTKHLNEHVSKTIEEMTIATTTFIRGEAAAAGKKKGNASWRAHDQSKRHASERRSDFRAGKFKPPPPMVTPVEKRSSNKFYDFYNDKGHNTDEYHSTKAWMNFMIVRSLSPYNSIIERPGIREIQAVPSMAHIMLKFPVDRGIVTIRSIILIPAECATVITSSKEIPKEAETPDAELAFKQLKQYLLELPLLVAPKPKEELIVYLSASHGAISAVLMTERGTVQKLVYFVNRALQGPELNYTPMEKLVLSLVFAAKRMITKMERHARRTQYHIPAKDVYERTDPSRFPHGSGAGLILTSPEGTEFTYTLRFQFTGSNNEAEYEALIAGLQIATQMGVRNVHVSVDSKLVANQVLGTYVAKEENMVKYLEKAKSLISGFANFSISQVLRSKNKKADALSKIASTSFAHLSKQTLPGDRNEASKLRIKARQYELLKGVLYRRSFLKPWLRYVGPLQADYVIREIHEGSCSMHAGPRSVVDKAMRLGYYWPTMHRDARDMIRACNDCQIHQPPIAVNPYHGSIAILQVKKFVWDNIVCRFGLPGEIVSDNGKQFSDNPFKDWCDKLNITQRFASVKHPQSNGLMERANRNLESVIPAEIGMPMYRTAVMDAAHNDEELRLNLDLLEERHERAAIREARANHAVDGGKLGPKWEGPYEVMKALGDGAYRLRSRDCTVLPRTWNIANLKKCYL